MYLLSYDDLKKTSTFFFLKPSKNVYIFIITICLLITMFFGWAIFFKLDEVVKAKVIFRPLNNISHIRCICDGELKAKYYKNNSPTKKGDILLSLDTTAYEIELEFCKIEYKKITDDLEINENLLYTINNLKIPNISKTSESYIKSLTFLTEHNRLKSIINFYNEKLKKEINQPEELKIPYNILLAQKEYEQQLLAFKNWLNQEKLSAVNLNKVLFINKKSLESKIAELERIVKNSTIYAPVDGIIYDLSKKNVGDYILTGEELLKIVPIEGGKLKAEIFINPECISKIKMGNPIKIRCPGLPPSKYGTINCSVDSISPDSIYINGESFFVAESIIDAPFLLTKTGEKAILKSGLTAEARITVDTNTALYMILQKLDFLY